MMILRPRDGMVLLVSYLGHGDGVIAVGDVTTRGAATVGGMISFSSAVFLRSWHVVVKCSIIDELQFLFWLFNDLLIDWALH